MNPSFSGQIFTIFTSDLAGTGFSFLLSIAVARLLGPGDLGLLVLLWAVIQWVDKLGRWRWDDAAVYLLGKKEYGPARISRYVAGLSLVVSFIWVMALGAGYPVLERYLFKREVARLWYFLALAHIPMIFLLTNQRKFLLALDEVRAYGRTLWFIPLGQVIVLLSASTMVEINLGWVLAVSFLVHLWIVLWSSARNAGHIKEAEMTPAPGLLGRLIKEGFRYFVATTPAFLQLRLDIFMVGYFLSTREVAFYSLAVTAGEMIWKLPNSVNALLFPKVSRLEIKEAFELTAKTFRCTAVIMIAMAACGAVAIRPVTRVFYGSNFMELVTPFFILLPGTVCLGLSRVLMNHFLGLNRLSGVFWIQLTAAFANITADLFFIPVWGMEGAALASALTYAGTLAAFLVSFKRGIPAQARVLLLPACQDFDLCRQLILRAKYFLR
ncbi:MAG: oligosaccharide flippase family protein [Elusimicrobia bacterium]|nr:oligosaccharide flippase family protein [Elusimicrobiota bacterium]